METPESLKPFVCKITEIWLSYLFEYLSVYWEGCTVKDPIFSFLCDFLGGAYLGPAAI